MEQTRNEQVVYLSAAKVLEERVVDEINQQAGGRAPNAVETESCDADLLDEDRWCDLDDSLLDELTL